MIQATLCFINKGNPPSKVLLGLKKAGFGQGKYNGFGGKVDVGETISAAAIRELYEETGVIVTEADIQKMGRLVFLFPAKPEWNQIVHVFVTWTWDGEPSETAEMRPAWFSVDEIPYEKMWQDDAYWLPLVLEGKKVAGTFIFGDDNETVDQAEIQEWSD